MTDLHTHVLPGMDDGAKTVEESLALLRMEREQRVDTVVLTPHFYRDRENPKRFLRRRRESAVLLAERLVELSEEERESLPRLILGSEVAWAPNLADWEELPELCIGNTQNLLLELPFAPWTDRMIGQIYDLMGRTGITPVLAHLERYIKIQRPEYIREVLDLGVPVQVSSSVLLRTLSRGSVLKMIRQQQAHLLASDCHNTASRVPDVKLALDVVRKKLGEETADRLIRNADRLAGVTESFTSV